MSLSPNAQMYVSADDEDSGYSRPLQDASGDPALDPSTKAKRSQMLADYLKSVQDRKTQANKEAADNQVGATDFADQSATASTRNGLGAIANAMNFTGALDPSRHVQSAVPAYMQEQNKQDLSALQGKQNRYQTALGQADSANKELLTASDEEGKVQAADDTHAAAGDTHQQQLNAQTTFGQAQTKYTAETDPNSNVSQMAREQAAKQGVKVSPSDTYQTLSENNAAIKDVFDRNTQLQIAKTRASAGGQGGRMWKTSKDQATGQVYFTNVGTGEIKLAPGGSIPVADENGDPFTDAQGKPWSSDSVKEKLLDTLSQKAQHDKIIQGSVASMPYVDNVTAALKLAADGNQKAFPEAVDSLVKAMQGPGALSDFKIKMMQQNESLWRKMQDAASTATSGAPSTLTLADMQQLATEIGDTKRNVVENQISSVYMPQATAKGIPSAYAAMKLRQLAPASTASAPSNSAAPTAHKPGDVVTVKGKGQFRVGADGDSLEAVQ